jgi:predicted transcriptional regulator
MNDGNPVHEELLGFFKALADSNRLKIVGLLANESLSVEEIAALLDLKPSTVSHHLARLSEAGLVSASAVSYYNVYELKTDVLERKAREILSKESLNKSIADIDMDAYDSKVIKNFTNPDGSLKAIPAQRKKFEALLRYVVRVFKPGVRYSEAEVNELLDRYHEDTAVLRRELWEYGLICREGGGGSYWLNEDQE